LSLNGPGTAKPSRASGSIPGFCGVCVPQSFAF
jgi:hypothetical protein